MLVKLGACCHDGLLYWLQVRFCFWCNCSHMRRSSTSHASVSCQHVATWALWAGEHVVQEGALDSTICAAGSDKGKCKSYVHMAVRRAVEFVEDYASPRMLCKPLCPQQYDASPVVASPHTKLGDWKCPFCEFVAQQADHALQNATTDKEILDFLRNSCQDLPQSFAAQCVEYVNTEGLEPSCIAAATTMLYG